MLEDGRIRSVLARAVEEATKIAPTWQSPPRFPKSAASAPAKRPCLKPNHARACRRTHLPSKIAGARITTIPLDVVVERAAGVWVYERRRPHAIWIA